MHLKRTIISILIFSLLLSICCVPAMATENVQQVVTYYNDGSYSVTTISEDTSMASPFTIYYKSGSKTHSYYSSSDELLWTFTVKGTFRYDGTTAEATSADYSYEIYSSAWSFKSATASCSGDTATAVGKFVHLGLFTTTATVSLTCSPTGVLS